MSGAVPKPPAELRADGRRLWRSIVAEYALEAWQLELLRAAAQSLDRANEARAIIERDGAVTVDRFGTPRANPAVAIERDSLLRVSRLVGQLDLAVGSDADDVPAHPFDLRAMNRGH